MSTLKRPRSPECEQQSSSKKPPAQQCSGIQLSSNWKAIGPFPAGMRETPFGPGLGTLVTSSTPYSSEPLDWQSLLPSDIKASEHKTADSLRYSHSVKVEYPGIDWMSVCSTAGNAGVQHQAMLRTELLIGSCQETDVSLSPSSADREVEEAPSSTTICITLTGAQEFALVGDSDFDPEEALDITATDWDRGDVYDHSSLDSALSTGKPLLGRLLTLEDGKYHLMVRASYEIALHGLFQPGSTPSFKFTATIEKVDAPIRVIDTAPLCVFPMVVDGKFAGDFASFGVQNTIPAEHWKVLDVATDASHAGIFGDSCMHSTGTDEEIVVPPLSTRKVSFKLPAIRGRLRPEVCTLRLSVLIQPCKGDGESTGKVQTTALTIPLDHVEFSADVKKHCSYRFTYLSGGGAQYATIQPPADVSKRERIILALHGAGVEADSEMWRTALSRQESAWILMPTGLTPWGLDWTMASQRAWQDLLASDFDGVLRPAVASAPAPSGSSLHEYGHDQTPEGERKVLLVGHSNGSQGALYALSRSPDSFCGAVLCSGYVTMKEYVSNNWQHIRNVSDPVLSGILQSSLSVFFNDLYAPHLVGKDVTVKFGSKDDNVPPWHSRLLATLISQWSSRNGMTSRCPRPKLIEIPDKGHWWPGCLSEPDIQDAIDSAFGTSHQRLTSSAGKFSTHTVRCVVPSETGYVHGIKILETEILGRVASVDVTFDDDSMSLHTHNVSALGLDTRRLAANGVSKWHINCDSHGVFQPEVDTPMVVMSGTSTTNWQIFEGAAATAKQSAVRLLCPMTLFLSGPRRILAVLPGRTTDDRLCAYESIAKRWADDVLLNTTINVIIVKDHDMKASKLQEHDYLLLLGGPEENNFVAEAHRQFKAVDFIKHLPSRDRELWEFQIQDTIFSDRDIALLYSTPHPKYPASDKAIVVTGTDVLGIERAGRLLPLRTGVPLPEWIAVGSDADHFGAGGVLAAGWYDKNWGWSPEMSYL